MRSVVLIIGLSSVLVAQGALVVIGRVGPTTSIAPYLKQIGYHRHPGVLTRLYQKKVLYARQPIYLSTLTVPVHSQLTVGQVISHPLAATHLMRPIFVIGDDPQSIAWARAHRLQLQQLNAVGLITNVQTWDRVKTIEARLGLALMPVSVTALAKAYHLHHYPFLLTEKDVEQ